MKQLFYFILLLAGISSMHSCKEMVDDEGNPLIDLNETGGLNGPRALYREVTNADTIAEYHYNGLLLSRVLTPGLDNGNSVTDIMYSGDKISKIDFKGFLDEDNDGAVEEDSISYTQLFTYGINGRLESISENRVVFTRTPGTPPTIPPGPWTEARKIKKLYNLTYNATTNKMSTITMRTGDEVVGIPFEYTNYSITDYEYLGDNVSKVVRSYGPMSGGQITPTVATKYGYEFMDYDAKISPYSLLPQVYKISLLLSTEAKDFRSLILSPNNPKRYSVTDLMMPIPSPVVFTSNYNYDAQTYMTRGFGVYYFYKPF